MKEILTRSCSDKIDDKTAIPPPDWESLIQQIARDIMEEHSPARILQVRAKMYDLLSHCIPPTTVLKVRDMKFPLTIILTLLDLDVQTDTSN